MNTEERAKTIGFFNPIYKIDTSLIVRTNIKIDTIKLDFFDDEYNKIFNNKANLYSKAGNKAITSFCAFPNIYDYTI